VSEPRAPYRIVAVGASAGGLHALRAVVAALPADFPLPVVIVQHRARESEHLCELLQECSRVPVTEVVDKQDVEAGVFVGPPDYHLLLDRGAFSLSVDDPVRYSRPSLDVMFEAVADEYGDGAIGIVLTGANADGSRGLRRIVDRGGVAIVQEPESAEVRVMPRHAAAAVPEAVVLPLEEIGARVVALASGGAAPRTRDGR
jgi:two-component system, chemotaxis family, protein-glutamate methylesterase/glutaminase